MLFKKCLLALGLVGVLCITTALATICHSCDGQACLRTSQVNVTKTCVGACVTIFEGYVPSKKGCYSELTTTQKSKCDTDGELSCYQCVVDRCNNLGRIDHKCKTCIATSSNSTCLNSVSTQNDFRCDAPRTQDVYCSTSILNGNTTRRACVMSNREILDCLNSPTTCSLCKVSAAGSCNTVADFPANRRQCLYCSGDNCELTNSTSTSAVSRYCPQVDDQCVSAHIHGVFARMCAQEVNPENRTYCAAHNTSCVYCSTNNCNTAIPPNSAESMYVNVQVVLAIAVAVMLSAKQ